MNRNRLGTSSLWRVFGAAALVVACALPAAAQTNVSTTDIQRLQDQIYEAGTDISRIRSSNADMAARLEGTLDDLRDEVVYLKVKLRKEGSVNRSEYADVRDRLQDLRSRARADARPGDTAGWRTNSDSRTGTAAGTRGGITGGTIDDPSRSDQSTRDQTTRDQSTRDQSTRDQTDRNQSTRDQGTRAGTSAIPAGQEIDVRLENELSSDNAQVEQRFEATTVADLYRGNEVLIPSGSVLRGVVSSVQKAGRVERKGSLTVSFDQVTVRGRNYPIRGTVTQALESEGIKGEAAKIGTGGAVGAIIGGIIGGVKGALLGVLIGGGGTIAATEGKDVKLPPGTILRVRLDTPPAIR
jgi:TolA-binding protein